MDGYSGEDLLGRLCLAGRQAGRQAGSLQTAAAEELEKDDRTSVQSKRTNERASENLRQPPPPPPKTSRLVSKRVLDIRQRERAATAGGREGERERGREERRLFSFLLKWEKWGPPTNQVNQPKLLYMLSPSSRLVGAFAPLCSRPTSLSVVVSPFFDALSVQTSSSLASLVLTFKCGSLPSLSPFLMPPPPPSSHIKS